MRLPVTPTDEWTTRSNEYNPEWVEEMIHNAYMTFCKDWHGRVRPHAAVLYYDTTNVEMFKTKPDWGNWALTVYIFGSNNELDEWIYQYGSDRVLDAGYSVTA